MNQFNLAFVEDDNVCFALSQAVLKRLKAIIIT